MNRNPMFHKHFQIIFFVFILLLPMGCKLQKALVIPTPKPMANWIKIWLENPVCIPPCWNNIVPGHTDIFDSQKLLEQYPYNYKITWPATYLDPIDPLDSSELSWTFLEDDSDGSIYSGQNTYVVSMIIFYLNSQISVHDIVSKYGAWDKVLIHHCNQHLFTWVCNVDLIFENLGMVVVFSTRSYGDDNRHIKVLPEEQVWQIILYPNKEGYAKIFSKRDYFPLKFYEWHGYGEYP